MKYNYLLLFLLLMGGILFLLVFAPLIDHIFYVDHKLNTSSKKEILITTLLHIILVAILIYILHNYIIKKFFNYFKLSKDYENYDVVLDLIWALTLTGLQRNLIFKLRYLSEHHPVRDKLII